MEKDKQCPNCSRTFILEDKDFSIFKKFNVPEPSLCPDCRRQRRLAQINQLNLFRIKCGATGQTIVSNYPPDSGYKVFSQKFWFSDSHDGINYGRDFDFSRPFFEQFDELGREVPRPALFSDFLHDENCEYTNYAGKNKNCYLIFDSDENRDCYYSYGMNSSRDSVDCYRVVKLELCYEATDCRSCYSSAYIYNCENCRDSLFLNNCIGCSNCIFCSNLRQKQYYMFNKPVPKDVFLKTYDQIKHTIGSYDFLLKKIAEFNDFKVKHPYKFMHGFHNEDAVGDYLVNCKNAYHCFDSMNVWDGRYCTQMFMTSKDVADVDECGQCELLYECDNSGYNLYNARFALQCMDEITNLTYCNLCFHCSDLFGCIGLKSKKHCILNKQYTKEEYEALVPRIIKHMGGESASARREREAERGSQSVPAIGDRATAELKNKEWGEYFPIKYSAFPYNLTVAQLFFPLSKEQALEKNYKWRDDDKKEFLPATRRLPDHIKDVSDSITNEILSCAICGKNYKIIPQELKFYRQMVLPLPRKCFLCRNFDRIKSRNPRKLWDRKCAKCSADIKTTYAPERPEIVYCEKCYLEAVY